MTAPDAGRPALEHDLALAHRLADAADEVTLPRFRAVDLRVQTKPDLTPVTDADRDAERAVRGALASARPGDVVLGEEDGESGGASQGAGSSAGPARRWVVDPVDGTKNFVRGVPVWATLLALQVDGEVVLGVVSAPALGLRWWAARGLGAWTGPSAGAARPCRVSQVGRLADASLAYSSLTGWEEQGRLDGFLDLSRRAWRTRAYGDFWSHCLVAEGAVDASFEPEVSLWDLAPLVVLVEEAGGRFTDLSGRRGPSGGSAVCSNGLLHEQVLAGLAATA